MFTATVSNWFLIGWISIVLGYVMNWIFEGLNYIGLPNIGLSIIIFTFVIKALLIPLSIRQQKYTKLSSIMQPELMEIQAKYKGKTDAVSVQAQQAETREVYDKYGTSPTGGCIQTLIQLPILFALYQVIYHLPGHITRLGNYYRGVVDKLMAIPGYETNEAFQALVKTTNLRNPDLTSNLSLIDVMYKFSSDKWAQFLDIFKNADLTQAYTDVADKIRQANYFLGIDLSMRPTEQITTVWWVVLIPILAGAFQYLSSWMIQTPTTGQDDKTGSMMKSMNIIFPLVSVFFCFMFEAGLGLYWVASAAVQCLIQLIVNSYINKTDLNEMIAKNVEKTNKKRAKKGLPPRKVTNSDLMIKNLELQKQQLEEQKKEIAEKAKESGAYYSGKSGAPKGSLSEKAGMVQVYDERQKELKAKGGSKK